MGHPSGGIMRRLPMLALLVNLLATLRSALRTRAELALENLALRQQLGALRCSTRRVHRRRVDRVFWIGLSQFLSRWSDARIIVEPDTVVRCRSGSDAPEPRAVQPPSMGDIVELPEVGGLHHRYERRAA
ncbi:MAG: hypothetical protein JXP73_14115 [Deltaproteobacteria bacterium]|nr:hypothetical protein [Deltaproteobacteria bacterium]